MSRLMRLHGVVLGCLGLVACGGRSTEELAGDEAGPAAEWSTLCSRTGADWLALEERLPGRWEYGSIYLELDQNLDGTSGTTLDNGEPSRSERWHRAAAGLVVRDQSCDFPGCIARSTGTPAVSANVLVAFALWPSDPCRTAVAGRYRARSEQYMEVAGELRLFSERSDELTLDAEGSWRVAFSSIQHGSLSDLGVVRWEGSDLPIESGGDDRGSWSATDTEVTLTRAEPDVWPKWFDSYPPGEPRSLLRVGPALADIAIAAYERR